MSIPEKVDVILLGTSLTNSILAAACSRIGKSTLHLDKNNYYGGDYASFTFQQLLDWIKANYPDDPSLEGVDEELIGKSRMFCIDLAPRFLYSNGPMVELLVKSNVARYHEFKNNIRILSMVDNQIHVMPCRRNEVFMSPFLSNLSDKRRLMKFIELCIQYEPNGDSEINTNSNKSIEAFLKEKGLNDILREFIINSIAMVEPSDTTLLACESIRKFMSAVERYGRSPFLFPLYGCGEFPQSFCRLSAVFGGVYCLNTEIQSIKIDDNQEKSTDESLSGSNFNVKFSGHEDKVSSEALVVDHNIALDLNYVGRTNSNERLSRAILITRKSMIGDEASAGQSVSFLKIPRSDANPNPIFVLEFNSSALVCPEGLNLLYLWTKSPESSDKPRNDLRNTVERIFKDDVDTNVLWEFYYHQHTTRDPASTENLAKNLYVTSPPYDDIDYSENIKEAERLFNLICPGQEFLPRAPDPDEIINT